MKVIIILIHLLPEFTIHKFHLIIDRYRLFLKELVALRRAILMSACKAFLLLQRCHLWTACWNWAVRQRQVLLLLHFIRERSTLLQLNRSFFLHDLFIHFCEFHSYLFLSPFHLICLFIIGYYRIHW